MKILLTGSSGFLGKYIVTTLNGFNVDTFGRDKKCTIRGDVLEDIPVFSKKYDLVIHCLGMAHKNPKSLKENSKYLKINFEGTLKIIKSLSFMPKSFVFISTVAVYGLDNGQNINEDQKLLAKDYYGRSKIKTENLLIDWAQSNNIKLSILRLPLVVGKNPPGNLKSITKAIKYRYYMKINNGNAKRSMVLAEDVASIIISASKIGGIYNLTDGYHPKIKEVEAKIAEKFGIKYLPSIPYFIPKIIASIGDYITIIPLNSIRLSKLENSLTFSDLKARKFLNWKPRPILDYI